MTCVTIGPASRCNDSSFLSMQVRLKVVDLQKLWGVGGRDLKRVVPPSDIGHTNLWACQILSD